MSDSLSGTSASGCDVYVTCWGCSRIFGAHSLQPVTKPCPECRGQLVLMFSHPIGGKP